MSFEQDMAALPAETQAKVESAATVMVASLHSELAVKACRTAEASLITSQNRWREIVEDRARFLALEEAERFAMIGDVIERSFLREMQERIESAQDSVVRHTVMSGQALEFMRRTTATLEQAIKLHVMGR